MSNVDRTAPFQEFTNSYASRIATSRCMFDPDDAWTIERIAALYECKSEVQAAIYRLYQVVPPHMVDGLIVTLFKNVNTLFEGGNARESKGR
jgi:hypothetical protein